MDLCKTSLSELIKSRSHTHELFERQDVIDFLTALVPLLAIMQKKGYLHRDIKPDNILICKSRKNNFKLTDFGFGLKLNVYSSRNVAGTM